MRALILAAVLAGVPLAGSQALELYGSFGTGLSFTNAQSGGVNWFGPHQNTGDGDQTSPPFTGALGVAFSPDEIGLAGVGLRLEIAGTGGYATRLTTNSFEPPTPTYFYQTDVNAWTGMANLWVDLPVSDEVGLYVGGGAGIARIHLETSDTVVTGSSNDTNFAWTAGAGVTWRVATWAVLDLGYRYVDLGETETELRDFLGPSVPPSSLTLDMTSHQILTSVRISFPSQWIF
jgi:opacity protein-like surface antigen